MKLKITTLAVACLLALGISAQNSRQFIRQQIKEKNECKSVAITKTNGDAMIYGNNGWAAQGCPSAFQKKLGELNNRHETIQDINLSESGRWCILWGENGMSWDRLYPALEREMRDYNEAQETITTITFNDSGDWAVVTTEHISASDPDLQDWLVSGCEDYGKLWTVCITDDAAVAVYEEGYKFLGDVPKDLKDALVNCSSDVYIVKIAGSSWFFRCTDGYWSYSM